MSEAKTMVERQEEEREAKEVDEKMEKEEGV